MKPLVVLCLLTCLLACSPVAVERGTPSAVITPVTMTAPPGGKDPSTFRERVFYEAWVRSVQDSDGDGIGDFPGFTSRLDELADLGIGGIWLMPSFPSPLADSGYDVSDYRAVHPDYGDLYDLAAFVAAAHERGILVYLDMVFNHTSDQHVWFRSALDGPSSPTFDYYIWSDEPATRCADVIPGPFGSSRWEYVQSLDRYYFHQFYPRQPDLNFRNPRVQEELLDILRFWMDAGIDGFRFDVPDRFFEDGNLCTHRPETIDFHARLRETISGTGTLTRGFIGEIWGSHELVKRFFGPSGDPMIFNFELMMAFLTGLGGGRSPGPLASNVRLMLTDLPAESRWGLVVSNHDTPRLTAITRDPATLRLAASVLLTLPGVPFLWMGEELGLPMGTQTRVDWRDQVRVPYPWSATAAGYGFSTAAEPHLAFAPDSDQLAWDRQRSDGGSLLNHYRRLIALRNATPALQSAHYQELLLDHELWAYARGQGSGRVIVVHNFSETEPRTFDWPGAGNAIDLLDPGAAAGRTWSLPPSTTRVLQASRGA